MTKKDFVELMDYNLWAKRRLLDSLASMKREDFERDLHSSHGGVRGTMLHMVNAENIWTSRLSGLPVIHLDAVSLSSISDISQKWDELDQKLIQLINGFEDDELNSRFEYSDLKGNNYSQPRAWALQQIFNHFTYHRGQIVAMQRQLGYLPTNSDLITFLRRA